MENEVVLPSRAAVGDPQERALSKGAVEASQQRSQRALLTVLCLVQVLWIAVLAYGAVEAQQLLRGLL